MNKKTKPILILAVLAVVIFGLIYAGISLTEDVGKSKKVVTTENAVERLNKLYNDVSVNQVEARKAPVTLEKINMKESLVDISKFPPQVDNTTENFIEIFSSTEKTGKDKDAFLVDVANDFNNANIKINGKIVSVRVRGIASGTGVDYISSGKYSPDVFTPSNELWGEMLKQNGVKVSLVQKRLVGNVPGILLSKKKNNEFIKKYGSVNLKNIVAAVSKNEIAMGYTNPFASSTGLNFLVSTLATLDSKDMLSEKAIAGFEAFQNNIPYVAYTTLQMRESAESGVLDGFIMEYQTYINDPNLKNDYVFTPFGFRHDSPVYAIGKLSSEKAAILDKFLDFCKQGKYKTLASDDGFNNLDNYKAEQKTINGDIVVQAQKLWKEKKNGSKQIAAVFVADNSGSMEGDALNRLKKSLLNGAQLIGKDNSIGLVTFSDEVNICLPINKFDINQRSYFAGAVEDMQASGGTAMFDGIIVASKMLQDAKAKNPNLKLMLFVLTDGETNRGHSLDEVEGFLKSLKIPIYSIGYNANVKVLESLSTINEATSINADSDDVIYKLQNLFNAQM